MAICAHNPAHVSKPKQKTLARGKREQPLLIPNKKKKQLWTHTREPSLWEWTKVVPSFFCHCLPDVNSAQGLSHQLKSKEWWNSIIFLKTAPPTKGDLKPNYSNSNKLMLKMLKMFKDVIHVSSPWMLKGENWEHVVWRAQRDLQWNPLK